MSHIFLLNTIFHSTDSRLEISQGSFLFLWANLDCSLSRPIFWEFLGLLLNVRSVSWILRHPLPLFPPSVCLGKMCARCYILEIFCLKYYPHNQFLAMVSFGTQVWKSCNLVSRKIYYPLDISITFQSPVFFWLSPPFSECELSHSQMVSSSQVFWNFPMEGPLYGSFLIHCTWHFINLGEFLCIISSDSSLPALFTLFFFSLELLLFGYWTSWIDPYIELWLPPLLIFIFYFLWGALTLCFNIFISV